jgi:hypothetical protein
MFCPKCSQLQASDQMRFCSRCGFPLATVAQLLSNDGALASSREGSVTPRQEGIRNGVKLILASLVIGFVMALLSVFVTGHPELFVPLTAGVLFLIGVMRIAYAYMFEQSEQGHAPLSQRNQLDRLASDYGLPPAQTNFAPDFRTRRANTAEMFNPPSITEHTTKLLD